MLGGHGVVYGISWVDMTLYMVWPGGHGIVYFMAWRAYGMAWWTWHGIWYGLAGMTWYIVWPGGSCHGLWYDLAGNAMVYGMACQARYLVLYYMTYKRFEVMNPVSRHFIKAWGRKLSNGVTHMMGYQCSCFIFRGIPCMNYQHCVYVSSQFL